MRRLVGIVAGTACLLALALVPRAQRQDAPVSPKLTEVLADLARAVPQEGGDTRVQAASSPKVSSDSMPRSVRDALRGRRLRVDEAEAVQVYVLLQQVTDDVVQQLTAAGATIEIRDPARRRVQARVPASRLQLLASLPLVNFVRLPNYPRRRTGAATTEGDAILHSDAVRSQWNIDGTGVRVGVISDGIKGVFATGCTTCGGTSGGPIASGDLPSATGTRNGRGVLTSSSGGIAGRSFQANSDLEGLPTTACAFTGAGAEGTALLEIVHDVAPGAQLAFANADTDLAFNQAVTFLAQTNDVVLDDLGFLGEAYDGTSSMSANTAAALNNGSNPIRTYVTSVGNESDEHYYGSYVDSGVDGSTVSGVRNNGHLHLFQSSGDTTDVLALGAQPYNLVSLPQTGEVVIFLTWDDRFGASGNNYDLYLVRQSTGAVVASSTDVQSGSQDPVEFIDFVNSGAADQFRILVQNVRNQAQATHLNLYSFAPECAAAGPRLLAAGHHERHNFNTATRSVAAQSDAGGSPVSVISAGAICSASAAAAGVFAGSVAPDESCTDSSHQTIEFFSSRGPTIDGRTKPDVTAIDGVGITGAGAFENPFFGTSAASPHVGAIAALVLQSAPCLLSGNASAVDAVTARTSLRNLILTNAAGLSASVPDNVFGYGRIDAQASVGKALPVFGGQPTLVVNGNTPLGATLTPAQLGFTDPNQCPLTRLFWTGGCGTAPDSTINCPFGTTKLSVSASNNGVGFSAAADIQVTVTGFTVGASPGSATVTAGQSAVFQVTLSPQGGAFTNSVTLACSSLPPGSACAFNPPTVTPGAGPSAVALTITTTARPAGSQVGFRLEPRKLAPVLLEPRRLAPLLALAVFFTIGCTACTGLTRRPIVACATALGVAGVILQAACGGGGTSTTPPSTSPPSSSSAIVAVAPATLTFGTQAVQSTSAPQTVSVSNSGSATATITGVAASGDFAQTNTCGGSLAAGAACTVNVTFTPTAAGSRSGTLSISDSASNSPQTVGLAGTGQTSAGGTPAGTYQVAVMGSAGALGQTASITLIVR